MVLVSLPWVLDQVACRLSSYISMVMNNVLNLPGNCSGRRRCIPGWRAASFLEKFGIWPPASGGWQIFCFIRDHFQQSIRWSFIVHNLIYKLSWIRLQQSSIFYYSLLPATTVTGGSGKAGSSISWSRSIGLRVRTSTYTMFLV